MEGFKSKYTGEEVEEILDKVSQLEKDLNETKESVAADYVKKDEILSEIDEGSITEGKLSDEVRDKLNQGGGSGGQGEKGEDGKSAYEIWLEQGNSGSEQDFLDSLKGDKGDQGEKGDKMTYADLTEDEKNDLASRVPVPDVDLSEYAKKSEVPTKTSQLTNDEGYLTEVPDGVISEKKLSPEVLEKLNRGGESEIPDGSVTTNKIANGAITEEKLSQGVKDKLNSTGGGGGADVDLSDYYTKEEVDAKVPTKTSQLTNDSGFIKEHQDISGKQDIIIDLDTIRANAAKGATALQVVPDNSVSEAKLTEAVRNKLNSSGGSGGGEVTDSSKYKVALPANYGVGPQKKGVATSEDYYNFNNMAIVNLVCKFLTNGNIYIHPRGELFLLKRDQGNYIGIICKGYTLSVELVINNTVLRSVSYGQTEDIWKALINSHSWVLTFDYVKKRILVKTKANATTWSMSFMIDISDWELDQLGDFRVCTEIGVTYGQKLGCKFFSFNNYVDSDYYLNTKLTADNYSPFAVTNIGVGVETSNLTMIVDGQTVETISPLHVVKSYNMENKGYFAFGCYAPNGYGAFAKWATRVKFREITKETKIYNAAGARGDIYVYDDEMNPSFIQNNAFIPEVDKWYIFVVTVVDNGASYSARYAFQLEGAGTIEVEGLYMSYEQTASIGSLNWDGEYFTGCIPFKGEGIEFEKITNPSVPPLYTLKEDSGKILMWNGVSWKQISNA